MAQRNWEVGILEDGEPGSPEAVNAAMALAYRFGPKKIQSLHDLMTLMDRTGGQALILVDRAKYTTDLQEEIPPELHKEVNGEWLNKGYIFAHESRPRGLNPIKEDVPPVGGNDRNIDPEQLEEPDVEVPADFDPDDMEGLPADSFPEQPVDGLTAEQEAAAA